MPHIKIAKAFVLAAAILLVGDICGAAVIVFDRVALVNQPVQLAVRTKGKLLPKGGQLVILSVGGTRLKQILTGGDGYGYLMFTPPETGLKTIEAVYEGKRESGQLLVMSAQERVILIDVETALRRSAITPRLREGSLAALESLNQEFRILYLYTFTGLTLTRQWLRSKGLPPSVALPWRNAAAIGTRERIGIRPHAIIGSASQLKVADKTIQHRFSFEETKDGRKVDNWTDVIKALEIQTASDSE